MVATFDLLPMLLSVLTYNEHSFNRSLSHMLLYVVVPLLLSLFHQSRYCFFGRVMLSYLLKSAHLSQEQGEKGGVVTADVHCPFEACLYYINEFGWGESLFPDLASKRKIIWWLFIMLEIEYTYILPLQTKYTLSSISFLSSCINVQHCDSCISAEDLTQN